jgi:hypothetical protein
MAVVAAIAPLFGPPEQAEWQTCVDGIGFLCVTWLLARVMLVGVGVSREEILVRRFFPQNVERIPIGRMHLCGIARCWWDVFLILRGPGLLPMIMWERQGGLWFWRRHGLVKDWDQLVEALWEVLEPAGKWQQPKGPWKSSGRRGRRGDLGGEEK